MNEEVQVRGVWKDQVDAPSPPGALGLSTVHPQDPSGPTDQAPDCSRGELMPSWFENRVAKDAKNILDELYAPIVVPKLGQFKYEDRHAKAWHIPTPELLKLLKKYSPLVSVFSGLALTECMARRAEGADIICTDKEPPPNGWCIGLPVMHVRKQVAHRAVRANPDRNVFMAWPPYQKTAALCAAKAMKPGRHLIYIGEMYYGCCATESFFDFLQIGFNEVEELEIPQHWGMHDECHVYVRK